jgi:hypothetical protein
MARSGPRIEARGIRENVTYTLTSSTAYEIIRQSFPTFGEYLVSLYAEVFEDTP